MAKKASGQRASGQHHGDLRRALLEAATGLLLEGGAPDLSLREVARRAGVTPAAPYHHFADKAALLAALGEDGFQELGGALDAAVATTADPRGRLDAMIRTYLRFAVEHAAHYGVMFSTADGQGDREPLQAAAAAAFDRLAAAVAAVRPDAAPEDVRLLATSVWALCHGLVTLRLDGVLQDGGPLPPFDALVERVGDLVEALVEGAGRAPRAREGRRPSRRGLAR